MKKKVIFFMIIPIIILLIVKIIPYLILKNIEKNETSLILIENEILHLNSKESILEGKYNLLNVIKKIEEKVDTNITNEQYEIILEDDLYYTINPKYTIKIKITNLESNSEYKVKYANMEKNLQEGTNQIEIYLEEGSNELNIELLKDDKSFYNFQKQIYYIEKYKKQFLDELSFNSVSTHFVNGLDNENTIKLLKQLGIKEVRDDIIWKNIEKENGDMDFSSYDKWINNLYENNIELIAILNKPGKLVGNDEKISSDEEVKKFADFAEIFAKRYPQVKKYEILNEPNLKYNTPIDLEFYSKIVNEISKRLKVINSDIEIIAGATAGVTNDEENKVSSDTFVKNIVKNCGNNIDNISLHQYDETKNGNWSEYLLKKNNKVLTEEGGFVKIDITEYGFSTYKGGMSQQQQAQRMIRSKVIYDKYNIETNILYNSRDSANNLEKKENNYGIFTYGYKPKESYYALKYFYENFNGAEYIGMIKLKDGLEAHVYDKDGEPKIITWATNIDNKITIPYEEFIVKDMYGNSIENVDGTLVITNSPVYLSNVSTRYFYEAISNTATDKYAEFEKKFATELSSINGIQEPIDKLKDYMSSIANNTSETQEKAIEMMNEHFFLGKIILDAFNNDKLNVEYVKISSMLDMLNDIGNAYEDLITVSATSRKPYYTATNDLINKAKTTINNNSDLNILYPAKILKFSEELHKKSEYINGLEEENDIKTGLIVSNSLHAYYLADWANDFAEIYVEKYIKENPVIVTYSNTEEFTNQDVIVTLNIGSDSKITNNNGKNTYKFAENGTFIFEYERRGQAFKEEITITNIDKEKPVISGVIEGKIYTDSAIPVIEDDNLANIEVSLNGNKISFKNGDKLTKEGIYNIIVTDKAGNRTSIEMYIIEKGKNGYVVDDKYILNVRQKTSVKQFAEKFNLTTEYSVKRNTKDLSNSDIVATGDILQLKSGLKYTIIVAGDINKDGKVTTYDLSAFRRYILNLRKFDEIESLAANINVDKQALGVKDYTRMRIEILGEF